MELKNTLKSVVGILRKRKICETTSLERVEKKEKLVSCVYKNGTLMFILISVISPLLEKVIYVHLRALSTEHRAKCKLKKARK